MKLTFRTIAGKSFSVEAEESLSISALKDKVQETQPDCTREAMKLVYKGKVLDDATTVADNQITEQGFIVVFVQPKKAEAPKPAAAPAPVRSCRVTLGGWGAAMNSCTRGPNAALGNLYLRRPFHELHSGLAVAGTG